MDSEELERFLKVKELEKSTCNYFSYQDYYHYWAGHYCSSFTSYSYCPQFYYPALIFLKNKGGVS